MGDLNLQTGMTVFSVGSAFAAFDDGIDVTLFPLVETGTLADDTTVENFVDANGTSHPYGGTTEGTVELNVLLTTTASRTWPIDNADVEGVLWINLVGEDASSGIKQLALLPAAKVVQTKSLALPGTSGIYKFSIGSKTVGAAQTAEITIAQGWPYETGSITHSDTIYTNRVKYSDVVIA